VKISESPDQQHGNASGRSSTPQTTERAPRPLHRARQAAPPHPARCSDAPLLTQQLQRLAENGLSIPRRSPAAPAENQAPYVRPSRSNPSERHATKSNPTNPIPFARRRRPGCSLRLTQPGLPRRCGKGHPARQWPSLSPWLDSPLTAARRLPHFLALAHLLSASRSPWDPMPHRGPGRPLPRGSDVSRPQADP